MTDKEKKDNRKPEWIETPIKKPLKTKNVNDKTSKDHQETLEDYKTRLKW